MYEKVGANQIPQALSEGGRGKGKAEGIFRTHWRFLSEEEYCHKHLCAAVNYLTLVLLKPEI